MQPAPDPSAVQAAPVAGPAAAGGAGGGAPGSQSGLLRNTVYLTLAQAATIPISIVNNALAGRYLGPEEFGYMYVASTLCAFAALAFEWGQQGAVPALVARDRSLAGVYLGTSLTFRGLASLLVAVVLAATCWLLGYQRGVLWAVTLMFPAILITSFAAAMKDTIRGFERTDIPAIAHVAQQGVLLLLVVPVLVLGGHLRSVLLCQIAVASLTLLFLWRWLRPVGVGALKFQRSALKPLLTIGTPFVFFDLAMVLLPNVNATFLAKMVPGHVIGWYGVSQRLVGLLIFPASALIGALYPTLCRLHVEDKNEFVKVTRGALYGVTLLAIPATVGCAMFPEIGVAIFGSAEFSGVADHLRVLSLFVLLVYFSMPLGTAVLAASRQRIWALVQCICIAVSVIGSPFLVPYFQKSMNNGAIGTCVTLVVSELFVVMFGLWLAPRGLFDRALVKSLLLSVLAGVVMGGVAWLTKPVSLFLAVPAAVASYAAVAWLSGAVQPSTVDMVRAFIARKLKRS